MLRTRTIVRHSLLFVAYGAALSNNQPVTSQRIARYVSDRCTDNRQSAN